MYEEDEVSRTVRRQENRLGEVKVIYNLGYMVSSANNLIGKAHRCSLKQTAATDDLKPAFASTTCQCEHTRTCEIPCPVV